MKHQILTILITIAVLSLIGRFAISERINDDTFIFIESRFKLWDETEKMLDSNFTITIFTFNVSSNNTYRIMINDKEYAGNFTQTQTVFVNTTDEFISINIYINNQTVLTISNIRIMDNITASGISQIKEPYKISLSPLDWNKKQWNIFYSVIIAAFISVIVSYLIIMRYRKLNGVMEIK